MGFSCPGHRSQALGIKMMKVPKPMSWSKVTLTCRVFSQVVRNHKSMRVDSNLLKAGIIEIKTHPEEQPDSSHMAPVATWDQKCDGHENEGNNEFDSKSLRG
jgi:hypothetical protein